MLEEFIEFANKQEENKRYNIYYLALNHHNIKKIKKFKNILHKGIIINTYRINSKVSNDVLFYEYYDFCYYYKYHNDIEEYNSYLKLIMDTINLYNSNGKCID